MRRRRGGSQVASSAPAGSTLPAAQRPRQNIAAVALVVYRTKLGAMVLLASIAWALMIRVVTPVGDRST